MSLLCTLVLYELPSVLTLIKVGWEPIPPVLVADQMLYLNLSSLHHVSKTDVINPWYGVPVHAIDVPHLIFPITFILFRGFHLAFASWTIAVLSWTAFWTVLAYIAAVYCLEHLFPGADPAQIYLLGIALLVLQSPLIYVGELKQFVSVREMFGVQLPYLRFAIPQVILPCILAYWGLQTGTLKAATRLKLGSMALLQFFVCAAFPYFLPVLAIGTGITLLLSRLRGKAGTWSWRTVVGFASVCGALDIGYVVAAGLGKSHANVHLALQFRPEMIVPAARPYMLLLLLAAILAWVSRTAWATRSTVVGLAMASALFGFADVIFSPEAQMLQHPNYVIGIVTWLTLLVCLFPMVEKLTSRNSLYLIFFGILVIGAWEAFSSYRIMLPVNVFQKDVIAELVRLNLNESDLVVAPSRFSDDISSWIPLLSSAKVLFTADGENILSANDTRTLQTSRQVFYLLLAGMDATSLEVSTKDDSTDMQIGPLLQQTDRTYAGSPLRSDRVKLRRALRERLSPIVSQFEHNPASSSTFLRNYKRILVVDRDVSEFFDKEALSKWLTIRSSYAHNGVIVYFCNNRFDEQPRER